MQQPQIITTALLQTRCVGDRSANLSAAAELLHEAKQAGAQLACLPELFTAPYPCQSEDHKRFELAEPLDGPTNQAIRALAKELQLVIIAGSIFEQRAVGVYHNTSVVFDTDGRAVGQYRKMHIPDDPLYYEKFYFSPGDQGFKSFATSVGNVGVCICWDQWFPEAARLTAMAGAELIFYPTAIGWIPDDKESYGESQIDAWLTVMRSHAITNGCFIAATNRVGTEDQLEFWGNSVAIDPYGAVLAQGTTDSPQLVVFEFDRAKIQSARTHWPFLRDRRIDAYSGLSQRWSDD